MGTRRTTTWHATHSSMNRHHTSWYHKHTNAHTTQISRNLLYIHPNIAIMDIKILPIMYSIKICRPFYPISFPNNSHLSLPPNRLLSIFLHFQLHFHNVTSKISIIPIHFSAVSNIGSISLQKVAAFFHQRHWVVLLYIAALEIQIL